MGSEDGGTGQEPGIDCRKWALEAGKGKEAGSAARSPWWQEGRSVNTLNSAQGKWLRLLASRTVKSTDVLLEATNVAVICHSSPRTGAHGC